MTERARRPVSALISMWWTLHQQTPPMRRARQGEGVPSRAPRTEPCERPGDRKPRLCHRDHHIEVGKAMYSISGNLIGSHVDVRADAVVVKVFFRGHLVGSIPASPRAGAAPTPPACLRRRPSTPCAA